MRACTAAITEVSYANKDYFARVEFVSRDSWQKEIDLLLADYRDAMSNCEGDGDLAPCAEISRAAKDRLWAVHKPSNDASIKDFDLSRLVEPAAITEAPTQASARYRCDDLAAFRKKIAEYLASSHRVLAYREAGRGPWSVRAASRWSEDY